MILWHGRTIAITGATGFVGSHAALEMRQAGANVVALTRATSDVRRLRKAGIRCAAASLDDTRGLTEVLRGSEFVIHAAGAVGFDDDWTTYTRVNLDGTRNLLAAAKQAGVRRFLHASSIVAVGGAEEPRPLDESAAWNLGSLHVPYVTTKRWAEEAALGASCASMDVIAVNPASVIGPDDFTESEFGLLCKRFWKRRIPFFFGGGNNYVDVRDVAKGIRLALERGRPGERYLLAGENRLNHAFFGDMSRVARRAIPRVRLPNWTASFIGVVNDWVRSGAGKRPYLTATQVNLIGWYFFFSADKATRELGFRARPLAETLADTHAFWMASSQRRSAA